jgi:Fic family protein
LFLLIHLSYLQAFVDVNKRTARLAANIPLIKANLVPLSFNDINRDDYHSAMIAIYELQEVRPLLDLYLFSYMRTCAMYDSTVKAVGSDEIRVRYRQQRHTIIRTIILNQLFQKEMEKYIRDEALELVKEEDQSAFFEDILEDITNIDFSRVAGLGITPDQLNSWLDRQKN